MEVSIDASEVTRLASLLEQTPQVIEAAKKEAIAAVAPKMKQIVDEEIGGTGKVRSWQGQYIGSKGLYAAVRPKAKTYAETVNGRKTRYTVGYVTNAINGGHRAPRAKFAYKSVKGKYFYPKAAARLGQVTAEVAESVCHAVVSHLNGAKTTTTSPASVHAGDFQPFTSNIGGKVYSFRRAGS